MYFLLVDRFYNADTKNDSVIDRNDPQAFHGGDLQGVEEKLDYLHNIGVDSIWISPIFTMRTETFHGHGAFHGYWVQHLDSIEKRFGGEDALKSLSLSMKERDMNLILDIVYNHVSFDSPMLEAHPDWFHSYPSIEDWNDPIQLTQYQVHGLPDLNQSRAPVYQYLLHRSQYWNQFTENSGFRIDAIRHLDNSFIHKLSQDLDLWLLGEDFNGNPIELIERAKATDLDALFDFPLYYAMATSFCDHNNTFAVASILSMDQYYPKDLQLIRFLDNHDLPRFYSRCQNDASRANLALSFLFSIQVLPIISYGTEYWQEGASEPENRASMQWNKAQESYLPRQIQQLTELRREYSVLEKGYSEIQFQSEQQLVVAQYRQNSVSYSILNLSEEEFQYSLPQTTITKGFLQTESGLKEYKDSTIPGNSLAILVGETQEIPQQETIAIEFTLPINGQYILVGNIPELGGWDPHKAPRFTLSEGTNILRCTLPKNIVLSYKLVEIVDGTNYAWETGENRFLWTNLNNSDTIPLDIK